MFYFRWKYCVLVILCAAQVAVAQSIIVNEYYNGSGTVSAGSRMVSDEYIEFAITQRMTSAQLAALTFGDSNDTTSALQGVFQFDKPTLDIALSNAGRSDFLAGTIIVVKGTGLGAQNLSYNPLATNTSNADAWSIQLVAGQGAKDHPETLINGNISIGNNGDVVWISSDNPPANNTDTSGFISAIGHSSGATGSIANAVKTQFGNGAILGDRVNTGNAVINVGTSSIVSLDRVSASNASMGTANGGLNSLWLTAARASNDFSIAPEPSRALLFAAGVASCLLRRRRNSPPTP